jgi:hypothetical protein
MLIMILRRWSVLIAIVALLGCSTGPNRPSGQLDASDPTASTLDREGADALAEAGASAAADAEMEAQAQAAAEASAAAERQARAQATAEAVAAAQQREREAAAAAEAQRASAAQPTAGTQPGTGPTTPNTRAAVAFTGDPQYSTEVRNGTMSPITVSLRNSGNGAASVIKFQISRSFLRGFTLRSTEPRWNAYDTFGEDLVLNLPGISAGAERDYHVNFMAGTTGDYPFELAIIADGDVVGQISGRTVILP